MVTVRLLTLNILRGGQHREPLSALVRAARPDVIVVNECPKTPVLWQAQVRRLATEWDMEYVAGGRSAGSNMLAVRPGVNVLAASSSLMPTRLGTPRRGLVVARLTIGGAQLGVVGCHLGLDPHRRRFELDRVIAVAEALDGPVVVAGDLNERASGPSWKRLREHGYRDSGSSQWRTFPAAAPTARIDALLVRGPAQVLHHGDPGAPIDTQAAASDHRGVLGVLDL